MASEGLGRLALSLRFLHIMQASLLGLGTLELSVGGAAAAAAVLCGAEAEVGVASAAIATSGGEFVEEGDMGVFISFFPSSARAGG